MNKVIKFSMGVGCWFVTKVIKFCFVLLLITDRILPLVFFLRELMALPFLTVQMVVRALPFLPALKPAKKKLRQYFRYQ